MLQDIEGKVAWVTGAGSGIGEAAVYALADAGVKLIISGRRIDRLEAVAAGIDGDAIVEPLDIGDKEAVFGVADRIEQEFGRLDFLIHSAGLNITDRSWDKLTTSGWDEVVNVDLNGAYYCCQSVLPIMRKQGGGLIINISSWAGRYVSRVSGPAYSAAKHALNAMNESINQEQCRYGIRACAICPGEVATEILDRRPVPVSEEDRGRMLQAEDLGDLILHVCRTPPHVCLNEILVSPTWNRGYIGR
ncbi:MAG TPA: SDR family oxidoreductase [Pseudomonadales bacterium]|nr:SDR family oxidoreductase [Pseudomonadales bacterium]